MFCFLLTHLFLFSSTDTGHVPLAPRGDQAATLFQAVPAETSGVDFVHFLERANHVPFVNTGAGVALEDVDSDGLCDIYLLSTDSPNKLYRQTAAFQFEDITAKAGVDGGKAWSRGAAFADVNGDGLPDLYVCNTEAPNLLYINQGDGTFKDEAAAYGVDVAAASIMAYFADYDRDGDLDMYLVTYRVLKHNLTPGQVEDIVIPEDTAKSRREMMVHRPPTPKPQPGARVAPDQWEDKGRDRWELAGQRDILFRNDGGKFTDVTESAGITDYGLGLSALWLDVDQDGFLDLYVGNDLTNPDRLWRNRGDGTFENVLDRVMPHTTWYSMGADAADINNDGLMDFMVADMAGSSHYRAKVGMGDMSNQLWFLTNEWPRQKMQNAVYLHSGLTRYQEVSSMVGLSATDWTWAVKFGDLDNDGFVDVFTSNGTPRDDMNIDLMGIRMMEVYEKEGKDAALEYIKTIPTAPSPDFVFRNTGKLKFKNVSQKWGLDHNGISFGAAYADLDRDGDLDLVVNHLGETAGIYRNTATKGNRLLLALEGSDGNKRGIGALVRIQSPTLGTQVRRLLPGRGFMSSDEPLVHFGLGKDTTITEMEINWPDGTRQTLRDVPVNRFMRITQKADGKTPSRTPDPIGGRFRPAAEKRGLTWTHKEQPFDDYASQPLLPGKLSQLGPGLAWGDANGDGRSDLYVSGAAGQSGTLFLDKGDGTFGKQAGPWSADAAAEDMAPLWFDANKDGHMDLLVTSGSSEHPAGDPLHKDRLYINDGKGQFTHAADALPADAHFSGAAAAADIDGDGDLDLFIGSRAVPGHYPISPVSRLLLNEVGQFRDVTARMAPALRSAGLITSALFSDVDTDGKPDLLLAVEWGPVKYFHNEDGRLMDRTEEAGLSQRTGWWNSITGGDFNGDGHMDYAVMNLGLNSKYKASNEEPSLLYYGDMDGSGKPHLIEAKQAEQDLLPIRGRSCSSAAMPGLADKFPTFHDFASATLPEIYTPTGLEKAKTFKANDFHSGIYFNNGKGEFTWQDLPRMAQTAPGYGVVATDFDGDGNCDLYAIQNFFTREPETGLLDGGLGIMLRGDGSGKMTLIPQSTTRLTVPGDGAGLTSTDFNRDGRPDLVALQNDGPLLAWENKKRRNQSLSVRLQGLPGNPTAVGARLAFSDPGGRVQTAEIYAGSGYLSQSEPIVFFGTGRKDQAHQLRVYWPDGTSSQHHVRATNGHLVVSHPALGSASHTEK